VFLGFLRQPIIEPLGKNLIFHSDNWEVCHEEVIVLEMLVDVSYAAPQAHKIVNVALHREYSLGIVFIFSQGRKDLYHG
jgi:hypothetical protein